jgi:hypothetical protein
MVGGRGRLALIAWVIVAVLGGGYLATRPAPVAPVALVGSLVPTVVTREIVQADDANKAGSMRSVMGQLRFRQSPRTSGPSLDRLDFHWDAPVRIVGVLVSVDDRDMAMTEMAVGIGAENYGIAAGDWLIHTSDTAGGPSTDEHIWFPVPYDVGPDEAVNVTAYLFNSWTVEHWVSPEVIVYYAWR